MAKVKCKGTKLEQTIASAYVPVAQIISLELPDMESETYEADTLDNADAGIPYEPTGRTEGGSCSGELFYDPALTGHKNLLELLRLPAAEAWKITFADTGASTWTFNGAGFGFGGTVALNDGLKGSFSIKLSGLPTFPTGGSAL
jgi:hypothetical protein